MAIAATDILFKTSTAAGAAGNSTAQATPGNSVGKYISTTAITNAEINNLFPDTTGDENAASNVDYQCFFVHNNHATLTLTSAVVYVSAEVADGSNTAIATDNVAASALAASGAQSETVANKNTAPTSVSAFSTPTTKATGLSIGSLAPGYVKAVWVRRTATNSAALNSDGLTVAAAGDTAA